jgi:hypothetical protein
MHLPLPRLLPFLLPESALLEAPQGLPCRVQPVTAEEKARVLRQATGQAGGVRRAMINGAELSLTEARDLAREFGAVICDCSPEGNGHFPGAIGPMGACPDCGTEGPFYRQAISSFNGNGKGRELETSDIVGKYSPVNWRSAFRNTPDEIDWLFPPLLEKGTINALFGKPGTGKSLLALNIVLELVRDGKTVTYFDDENRVEDIVERLRDFGCRSAEELESLYMYSFAGLPALDTPEGGEHLAALAAHHGSDLVVLDTTTRMVGGDENAANTFLQLYRCSLVPLKSRGITVLRIDHPGKDENRGQRGSSAKAGDVDTIWRLFYEQDGMLALEREKSRSGHGENWIGVRRVEKPFLRHDWAALENMPLVDDKIKVWADRFDRWGIPRDAGRPTLRAAVKERTGQEVSTTLLWLVAKYRKSLQQEDLTGMSLTLSSSSSLS